MNQGNDFNAIKEEISTGQAELNAIRGWLIMAVSLLIGLGLVLIYSASAIRSGLAGYSTFYYVEKQFLWIAISVGVMLLASRINYHRLEKMRWWFLLIAFGLLAAVLIPGVGTVTNGARRWFRMGSMSIQPSEAVKILMVIVTAAFLSRAGNKLTKSFKTFILAASLPLAAAAMIAIEPDLGTAALIAVVLMSMLFVAGAKIIHILASVILVLPAAIYYISTHFEYVVERFSAWLIGGSQGKAYHAYMSLQSMKSGGIFGLGPGQGWAKHGFLPAAQNDFIFAVAGQEFGLIGMLGIVLTFLVIVISGFRLMRRTPDAFGTYLVFGLTMMLGLQAAFNIGVVTSLLPTKGISLPFVSFGGSGLICSMAMLGLLASVTRYAYSPQVDQNESQLQSKHLQNRMTTSAIHAFET